MDYKWYRSKTVWTIILMFVTGGMQTLTPVLNPDLSAVIMAVLGMAGAYFHLDTAHKFGAVN